MIKSQKARRIIGNVIVYLILAISAVIWVFPIFWLVMQSFGVTNSAASFVPNRLTLENYVYLFGGGHPSYADAVSEDTMPLFGSSTSGIMVASFLRWFLNTLVIAVLCCIISTAMVLMVAYALSRFRFKSRTTLMKLNLVLGMFPGFLGMIINYWVMKEIFHLDGTLWALVILYTAGSGMGFFISKGFFDTISKSIDEAAMIDGASRAQIFWHIILPLAKPIVVYTMLTSFMGPWGDYITSSYIIGLQNSSQFTVAIGLYRWATVQQLAPSYYTRYAAGSVVVAIPMATLFIATQKYYVGGVTGGAVKG